MTMRIEALGIEEVSKVHEWLQTQKNGKNVQKPQATSTNGVVDLQEVTDMLDLPSNTDQVLLLLKRSDWLDIIALLPQNLLINALRLFNKEKLLQMTSMLPPGISLQFLLQLYPMDQLIQKMPTTELMAILHSQKLDNRALSEGIMQWDPQYIELLMQRVTGRDDFAQMKPYDYFKVFLESNHADLMEGLKTMPFKVLQPYVTGFVKADQELLFNMSDSFVGYLMDSVSKTNLLQASVVIPPSMLLKMLSQLPDQMLLMAASQVDNTTFANYLMSQQSSLLKTLAAA